MVLRALASPLPIAWVTADAAYGQEWRFRRALEETAVGYVLAVPKSQPVPRFGRIDHLFSQAPDEAWEQRSCGNGAKGPRVYDWAAVQLPVIEDFDSERPTHHRWDTVYATNLSQAGVPVEFHLHLGVSQEFNSIVFDSGVARCRPRSGPQAT